MYCKSFAEKPKILILDDSTSAVDTKTDSGIRKAMREYIPETTKIIIAQRTASVEDADRIIVMDGGKSALWELIKNCLKAMQYIVKFILLRTRQVTIMKNKNVKKRSYRTAA